MRLISWNTAGRKQRVHDQLTFISRRRPDVVALQEITATTRDRLRPALADHGLADQLDTFDVRDNHQLNGARRYGVMIASRKALRAIPTSPGSNPWPERMLSIEIETSGGPIEIHAVHIPPGSSNGWVKIETLESIYDSLAHPSPIPRVLCGDFNTPREERPDGTVVTWGQRIGKDGTIRSRRLIRGGDGARWDAGERSVLVGLRSYDLPDVFRALHGYSRNAYSWPLNRKGKMIAQRRFDHVFASTALRATSFEYLHEAREAGLSDHAAVEVVFDWPI